MVTRMAPTRRGGKHALHAGRDRHRRDNRHREGERDEAPMLFIGEQVGADKGKDGAIKVDIAVDPLEGTNLCASGAGGAITVLAASEHGAC